MSRPNKEIGFIVHYLFKILQIIGFIGIPYLLYFFGRDYYHFYYYEENTYGVVDSITLDWYDEKTIHYSFEIDNESYSGTQTRTENINVEPKVGDRYRIRYSSKNPEVNQMVIK